MSLNEELYVNYLNFATGDVLIQLTSSTVIPMDKLFFGGMPSAYFILFNSGVFL